MSSTSETGHVKIETTFFDLKTFCTGYGVNYDPSNPAITVAALTTAHAVAKDDIQKVKIAKVPFDNAEGERFLTFKPLKSLASRIVSALKGVNAPSTVIKDAQTILRKMQGKKAPSTPAAPPALPGIPEVDPVSVSQQSYDMQLDHFKKLVLLVEGEPLYNPNEVPLKTVTLNTFIADLEAKNQAVIVAYVPYSNAMMERNISLYAPETGLIDLAQDVKNYVKSAFGATSPEFLQIKGLRFPYPHLR